jgi:dipeptidyl aminopeptidase/acylaminoacyl peptidase
VADLFGPADMVVMFQRAGAAQLQPMFGTATADSDAVRKVSPVVYVTGDDPPFLILHGDKDTVVPLEQSQILDRALKNAGVPSTLIVIKNAGHSFTPSPTQAVISPGLNELALTMADFFDKYLLKHT